MSLKKSTILQFRATDWGMERCVLHLLIPRNDLARNKSLVDVWELDNTAELAPGIAWGQAPKRVTKLASLPFVAGESAGNLAIDCKSGTFPTFEFACAVGTTACFVEFWQDVPVYMDGTRWKTNGDRLLRLLRFITLTRLAVRCLCRAALVAQRRGTCR